MVYHNLSLCYNNSKVNLDKLTLGIANLSRPLINYWRMIMQANISITDMVEEFSLPQITIKKSEVGVLWSKGLISFSQLQTLREGYSCIADVPKSTAIEYGLNTG